jgi:hypothetical protein
MQVPRRDLTASAVDIIEFKRAAANGTSMLPGVASTKQ